MKQIKIPEDQPLPTCDQGQHSIPQVALYIIEKPIRGEKKYLCANCMAKEFEHVMNYKVEVTVVDA